MSQSKEKNCPPSGSALPLGVPAPQLPQRPLPSPVRRPGQARSGVPQVCSVNKSHGSLNIFKALFNIVP